MTKTVRSKAKRQLVAFANLMAGSGIWIFWYILREGSDIFAVLMVLLVLIIYSNDIAFPATCEWHLTLLSVYSVVNAFTSNSRSIRADKFKIDNL